MSEQPSVKGELFARVFEEVHRLTKEGVRSSETSMYAFSLGSLSALVFSSENMPEIVDRITAAREDCGSQAPLVRAANFMLDAARDLTGEDEPAEVGGPVQDTTP